MGQLDNCSVCTKYYDCKVSNGPDDYCSRFKSKAKRGGIWATVLVIAVALMLWLCGCDTGRTVDIWQGTYKTGPRAFIDTDIQEFTADLTQGDERAVVKLKGYKSEAAEVLAVLLSQYTLAPRVEGDGQ